MKPKVFTLVFAFIATYAINFPPSSGQSMTNNLKSGSFGWSANQLNAGCPDRDSNCADCIEKKILDKIHSDSYRKDIRPRPPNNAPTVTHTNALIYQIDEIDSAKYTFTMTISFRQLWNDKRLSYSIEQCPDFKFITLGSAYDIWKPGTFFRGETDGLLHTIPEPNVGVRIYPNGDIIYSQRLSLKLPCQGGEGDPGKELVCTFQSASYSYTADDVEMHWTTDPIQIDKQYVISPTSGYIVGEIKTEEVERVTATGKYRSIIAYFHFIKK